MPLDKDLKTISEKTGKALSPHQQALARAAAARGRQPQQPQRPTPPSPRPPGKGPQRRRKRKVTVTTNDSYKTLADLYNVPQQDIINQPGNPDNLVAGQVITLPPGYGGRDTDFGGEYTGAINLADAARAGQGAGSRIQDRYPTQPTGPTRPDRAQLEQDARMRDVVADYKRGQQDIADASSFDRTFQEAEQPPATLSEMLGQPIVDFGKWLGNITTAGVSQFTGTREADPYVNTGPPRFGPDGEGPPGLGDYVDPAQQDTGADPPGIEDTDYQGPAKTDEDGWVLYKGKRIRPDMFLDYLYSQNQEPFELDENGIPTSPYWAKQVFIQGSKKTLESMGWAEYLDNRDMLPNTVTAAQLDLLGPNSKYTDEYMRDVLNYRWDPELGAWIKQEETAGIPGDGGGGGSGYGYGGGGYGGGYTEKKYPRSGQYLRGGTGVEPIQDRGYVQPGRGIAPVHWRF